MNEPSWSFTGSEDARDSMSLLSEESCTSSAVKDKQTKNSFSNLTKIKSSNNNHLCELQSTSKKNMKNLYAAKVASASLDGFHRERNYNRTANFERESSLKWSREAHYSRELSAVRETSEPLKRSPLKDKCMSFDEDSILNPLHGAMGTDITSMDCKIWSEENICGLFPSPKVYPNVESCSNKSKSQSICPFDCAPFGSFFPEKDVLKRPVALTHSSDCQPSYPCCLADCKDESRIQLTESGKVTKGPEKEISLLKSDLSSEKGKALDVVDIKDSRSGDEEDEKEETPEFIENPKMEKNLDCVEANLTRLKEIPAKLESLIQKHEKVFYNSYYIGNSTEDLHPLMIDVNKENGEPEGTRFGCKVDSSADQSYKVMLESYVLQLLCVQKVLKESSQQDTVKKV